MYTIYPLAILSLDTHAQFCCDHKLLLKCAVYSKPQIGSTVVTHTHEVTDDDHSSFDIARLNNSRVAIGECESYHCTVTLAPTLMYPAVSNLT